MKIIVPFSIWKRELGGSVPAEAKKIFDKLKEKPVLGIKIAAKGLPERTTLYKVYATTDKGARRLLFFCHHAPASPPAKQGLGGKLPHPVPERWVLLFYRPKGDEIGDNMSNKNAAFVDALGRYLSFAINDIVSSTLEKPLFEEF